MELVLPMFNAHPYFSLKNLGKKVHIIHGKMVIPSCSSVTFNTCGSKLSPSNAVVIIYLPFIYTV